MNSSHGAIIMIKNYYGDNLSDAHPTVQFFMCARWFNIDGMTPLPEEWKMQQNRFHRHGNIMKVMMICKINYKENGQNMLLTFYDKRAKAFIQRIKEQKHLFYKIKNIFNFNFIYTINFNFLSLISLFIINYLFLNRNTFDNCKESITHESNIKNVAVQPLHFNCICT
eukprot:861179_1